MAGHLFGRATIRSFGPPSLFLSLFYCSCEQEATKATAIEGIEVVALGKGKPFSCVHSFMGDGLADYWPPIPPTSDLCLRLDPLSCSPVVRSWWSVVL
jgi:hypothetical protein